jgi:hypothetical protein
MLYAWVCYSHLDYSNFLYNLRWMIPTIIPRIVARVSRSLLFHHVACHYYITAGNDDMNPSIEQITLKKISWRIVPFVMFAYFIAFSTVLISALLRSP